MVAVALCELHAARAPDGTSVPVFWAMWQGILESPRCSGLKASCDWDTARRVLRITGQETTNSHFTKVANRVSQQLARRLPRPSAEMRNAFYDYTGLSPADQVVVEGYLLGATQRGRVLLSHPGLTRLLRQV